MRMTQALVALIGMTMLAPAAMSETVTYTAELLGKNEVPPNDSKAKGQLEATYDKVDNKLTWSVNTSGLSGNATAAHFHGPAKDGENAKPLITLEIKDGKMSGSAILTTEQSRALADGTIYLNVHTAKFPDGEIRGQLRTK